MAAYGTQPAVTVLCPHCGTNNRVPPSATPTRAIACAGCARSIPVPLARQTFTRSPRSEEHR